MTACSSGRSPAARASLSSVRGESGMSSGVPWMRGPRPARLASARPAPTGCQRALVDDVVQHEPVEHDVEGGRRERQLAGAALKPGVELVRADQRRIEVRSGHPPGGPGEQVAARVPAAAHRQHVAAAQLEPAFEQQPLAALLLVVVDLERGRVRAAVEQVVRLVGLAHQAPRVRKTAGIVLSRMVRSRKTDQRSR